MESHQCDNETKWNERMLLEDLLYFRERVVAVGRGCGGEQVGVTSRWAWRDGGRGERAGVACPGLLGHVSRLLLLGVVE